jgi:hypothetical protein
MPERSLSLPHSTFSWFLSCCIQLLFAWFVAARGRWEENEEMVREVEEEPTDKYGSAIIRYRILIFIIFRIVNSNNSFFMNTLMR